MAKLLYLPLLILIMIAFISIVSFGTSGFDYVSLNQAWSTDKYYDVYGRELCYSNLTSINEQGSIINDGFFHGDTASWYNGTMGIQGFYYPTYPMYTEPTGTTRLLFSDVGKAGNVNIALTTTLGFIAIVIGITALVLIVGLHILGSGISEISVDAIYKSTAYLAIWGVLSAISYVQIVSIPMNFGMYLYLGLTVMYTLGIVNSVGHPQGSS
jgi:hypothetical protein